MLIGKCDVNFFLDTALGKAVLQYENEGHNTMNMYHTGVPTEYRGQGIAGHLAKVCSYKEIIFQYGMCISYNFCLISCEEIAYHCVISVTKGLFSFLFRQHWIMLLFKMPRLN